MDRLRQTGSSSASGGGWRLRLALITIEVALSLSLLVAAGLMLRTLGRLAEVDPGYRPQGLLAMSTQQPGAAYGESNARRAFAKRLVGDLQSTPGVSAAALAWPLDQVSFSWSPYANFPDKPFAAGREPSVQMAVVTPAFFETMGIPLRRGRVFDDRDREGTPVVASSTRTWCAADAIADTVGDRRMLARLLTVFAALALGLTALGIAGVVSFVVAQRAQEIGLRIALGARPATVVRMVVGSALSPVVAGLVIGAAATAQLTQLIQRFLYQVAPSDPISIAGAAAVLVAAALIAAYVPARRATRIDPLLALRTQ
jgi:FtsX-like permease family